MSRSPEEMPKALKELRGRVNRFVGRLDELAAEGRRLQRALYTAREGSIARPVVKVFLELDAGARATDEALRKRTEPYDGIATDERGDIVYPVPVTSYQGMD